MKRLFLFLAAVLTMVAAPAAKPKLVLTIVIDQFRYDYLTRFRADYTSGFVRILKNGAVFTDAHYIHYPTVTAVGHSTVLSGAPPSLSGIAANEWFDRETGVRVTSVSDPSVQLLGGAPGKTGSSPNRLLVSTVGDELKMAGRVTKSIGISFKDRSAILTVGHAADAAYWFDDTTGNWVSSTYYFSELPGWMKDVNKGRPGDKYLNADWTSADGKAHSSFGKMTATPDAKYYKALEPTPFANEMIESVAERCVTAEQMGRHAGTDLLSVSFSGNDYVGHDFGPDSPEVRDISIRTDRVLGKLFAFLDTQVGSANYLVVLTADHGVAPTPEAQAARKMPGGRIRRGAMEKMVEAAIVQKFGEGKWLLGISAGEFFLNHKLIGSKHLNSADVERTVAEVLRGIPHIARVYTAEEIVTGRVQQDSIGQALSYGYNRQRSGDVFIVPESYWFVGEEESDHGTTHGTPYNYDNHVPVVFMGPGIRAGQYNRRIAVNDIAPTLATLLEVETPSGSVGRVLDEMWAATPVVAPH
jgi:predicted AlkP superfamily pyrophosphatase or phosphodiesterase